MTTKNRTGQPNSTATVGNGTRRPGDVIKAPLAKAQSAQTDKLVSALMDVSRKVEQGDVGRDGGEKLFSELLRLSKSFDIFPYLELGKAVKTLVWLGNKGPEEKIEGVVGSLETLGAKDELTSLGIMNGRATGYVIPALERLNAPEKLEGLAKVVSEDMAEAAIDASKRLQAKAH